MKSIAPRKFALLSAIFCAVMLAFAHNASALSIGDTHELGYVWPGVPSGNALYVNHLIGMALGTIDAANGQRAWGVSDVRSWYKNEFGRVAQNWPFSLFRYWEQTRRPNPDDFVLHGDHEPAMEIPAT